MNKNHKMKKGRSTKRDRDDADEGEEDPLVKAIEGIELPDHSDAISEIRQAVENLTDAVGRIDVPEAPNYGTVLSSIQEEIQALAQVMQRGISVLEEAVDMILDRMNPAPDLFDMADFGKCLCRYMECNIGIMGCKTICFAVVPNAISGKTDMYTTRKLEIIMAMRVRQWEVFKTIDDDIFETKFCERYQTADDTIMHVLDVAKKMNASGNRMDVTAKVSWRPDQLCLDGNHKFWRKMCCERAAVAFMAMSRYGRGLLRVIPRDVMKLIAANLLETKERNEWKIKSYMWFYFFR